MGQKGLKIGFWDQKYLFLAEFSLSRIGGYPPPPLNRKIPLSSFWQVPYEASNILIMLNFFWETKAMIKLLKLPREALFSIIAPW